ncbi:hypothetical protein [Achromobacter xylosoxidans]|uniref:hypothetical protein n=1 Tax=Alcaligenes xylosoxydans xylosoxydans TaxID=85698 RepID=UPI001F374609|nr:hypothetical protein [Achromobacter xylosoxidans]
MFGLEQGGRSRFETAIGPRECRDRAGIGLGGEFVVTAADGQFGAHPPGQCRVEPLGQGLGEIVAAHAIGQRRDPIGIGDALRVLGLQRGHERLQRRVGRDVGRAAGSIGQAQAAGLFEVGERVAGAVRLAVDDIADTGQAIRHQQALAHRVVDQAAGSRRRGQRPVGDQAQRFAPADRVAGGLGGVQAHRLMQVGRGDGVQAGRCIDHVFIRALSQAAGQRQPRLLAVAGNGQAERIGGASQRHLAHARIVLRRRARVPGFGQHVGGPDAARRRLLGG